MTGTQGWKTPKRLRAVAFLAGAFASALIAGPAVADMAYKVTSIISLPGGQQITSVDIGFTDPLLSQYAVTDRKNKSVDVFDTKTNTLLFQTVGFCGIAGTTCTTGTFASEAGPNGLIYVDHKEIWAADGDSSIKVVDLGTHTITHTIPLGLTKRADELCHDPVDNLVLIASDKDAVIQFIDTKSYTNVTNTPSHKIVLDGTGSYPNATNGIEQCQYNPHNGLFYLAIPEVNGAGNDQTPGAVIVISPQTQKVVATMALPLSSCAGPQGLTIGPAPQILLGCSNNGPATAIIDERDGHVLATFQGLNGNDEVYFDSVDNHYFLAQSNNSVTPQLGIIDAITLTAAPSIPTGGSDHSVAADPSTGNVYVPIVSGSSNICSTFGGSDANGCIAVITSQGGPAKIVAAVAPTSRTSAVSSTLGTPTTAFATIINASTVAATKCSIQLPAGVPADFKYQTTDPATNTPTGTANTPVDIAAGATKTFYFAITPTGFFSQDIPLVFVCDNTDPAPSIPGLNTFLLTVSNPALADMLSITDTLSHDGFINVPGTAGTGLMVAAAINLGAAGTVTFTPLDTPFGQLPRSLPLALNICQTNASGTCLATPGPSVTIAVNNGQTVLFSIFVTGQGKSIATNPAFSRVFLVATQGTSPVGQASSAVKFVAGPSS